MSLGRLLTQHEVIFVYYTHSAISIYDRLLWLLAVMKLETIVFNILYFTLNF